MKLAVTWLLLAAWFRPCAGTSRALPLRHFCEEQRISYGIQLPEGRAPFAFGHALAEDLMTYLQEDPHGPFMDISQSRQWGFEEDTINEDLESIWKADWHATAFWATDPCIFVPRIDQFLPSKQPPLRILAFLEAFRQVSAPAWERILDALNGLGEKAAKEERDDLQEIVKIFCEAVKEQNHFSGVEAQIWKGGPLIMDSHTDGATSLLHLSLTLQGRRSLRVSQFKERHSPYRPQESRRRGKPPGDEVSVWNDDAYTKEEIWDIPQTQGSVYVTSPFCFEHGVKYESQEAVFALQCLVFKGMPQGLIEKWYYKTEGTMSLWPRPQLCHEACHATDSGAALPLWTWLKRSWSTVSVRATCAQRRQIQHMLVHVSWWHHLRHAIWIADPFVFCCLLTSFWCMSISWKSWCCLGLRWSRWSGCWCTLKGYGWIRAETTKVGRVPLSPKVGH